MNDAPRYELNLRDGTMLDTWSGEVKKVDDKTLEAYRELFAIFADEEGMPHMEDE